MCNDHPVETLPQANSGCCGGHAAALSATTAAEDTTTCLVMAGTPVVKSAAEVAGLYRDHDGQRYWFCCAACGPLFDADPQKYIDA